MADLTCFYKTVAELLWNDGHRELSKFCNEEYMSDNVIDHDNWDGGIDTFNIELGIPVPTFSKWKSEEGGIEGKEKRIEEAFETVVKGINSIRIANAIIRPSANVNDQNPRKKKPLSLKLHFEVQRKNGKRSDYLGSVEAPKRYPCFILVFNWDWFDYEYSTWFCLFYFASVNDKKKIGELKIMQTGQKNTMRALPKEFDEPLDNSFCSLGIETDYYVRLRNVLKEERLIKEVQHYLCDCSFNPIVYDQHCGEDIFKKSLMRDLSANEALNEGQALAMGIEPDEMYSFKYTYHPEADASLYAIWEVRVSYKPLKFMRSFGVIGNNGVGKTQILSKFVADLLNKNVDNFEILPLYKSLLVICSTPFDAYPAEPQEGGEVNYKLCCLEQDKISTVKELGENIKKITNSPTVKNESMLSIWQKLTAEYVDNTFVNSVIRAVSNNGVIQGYEIDSGALEKSIEILSSGQLHILSLVTYICAHIHYRSLLIIDEPEVHLHPHITMEFMASLSKLLSVFKSYSIIATHTPLVIREMAGKNVFLMQKMRDETPQIAPVAFETLGEDLSSLYRKLFGYDENSSFFKKMVDDLCEDGKDYQSIVEWFQRGVNLNVNALLIIRDAIIARDNA